MNASLPLTEFKISNFKSFKDVSIKFDKYNIFIGKNGSGKSNFVSALKFTTDIIKYGVEKATKNQGGVKSLFPLWNQQKTTEIKLEISGKIYKSTFINETISLSLEKFRYKIILCEEKEKGILNIIHEYLEVDYTYQDKENKLSFTRNLDGKVEINDTFEDSWAKRQNWETRIHPCKSVLEGRFNPFFVKIAEIIEKFCIYNFNPYLAREIQGIESGERLEFDGSNLASVIAWLYSPHTRTKERLELFLNRMLEFTSSLTTVKVDLTNEILIELAEKTGHRFKRSQISEGTTSIILMIVALFFQPQSSLVLIEEPEKFLHVSLIRRLANYFLDATSNSNEQVIIITHSPLLASDMLNNVFLIEKNEKGETEILPATETHKGKTLLNELGFTLTKMMEEGNL